ncbi:hypothetical protein HYH03_003013 [Edaphochlamys debaryana]|uniref:Protein kinase domain-containing protein n=1 Tax=Edaphochlamys debaryana TaxID=47281 RepID=A0A836C3I3_9CHLO|nr:hypothetical protein HYH03_003013 [Edaphochlamys debaryana]|eukprot:KAG2498820.1 hypothetical protein HYH03_003013 [Edaphochlamys debaryana]
MTEPAGGPGGRGPAPARPALRIKRQCGRGGFATVHLGVLEDVGAVAVKVLRPGPKVPAELAETLFLREAKTNICLQEHPNLVKCYGLTQVNPNQVVGLIRPAWALIFEYCGAGTLYERIAAAQTGQGPAYTDAEAISWLLDVARALEHLHGLNPPVIHRDVKAENVLLKADDVSGGGVHLQTGDDLHPQPQAQAHSQQLAGFVNTASGLQQQRPPRMLGAQSRGMYSSGGSAIGAGRGSDASGGHPYVHVHLTAKLADLGIHVVVGEERSVMLRARHSSVSLQGMAEGAPPTFIGIASTDGLAPPFPVPASGVGESLELARCSAQQGAADAAALHHASREGARDSPSPRPRTSNASMPLHSYGHGPGHGHGPGQGQGQGLGQRQGNGSRPRLSLASPSLGVEEPYPADVGRGPGQGCGGVSPSGRPYVPTSAPNMSADDVPVPLSQLLPEGRLHGSGANGLSAPDAVASGASPNAAPASTSGKVDAAMLMHSSPPSGRVSHATSQPASQPSPRSTVGRRDTSELQGAPSLGFSAGGETGESLIMTSSQPSPTQRIPSQTANGQPPSRWSGQGSRHMLLGGTGPGPSPPDSAPSSAPRLLPRPGASSGNGAAPSSAHPSGAESPAPRASSSTGGPPGPLGPGGGVESGAAPGVHRPRSTPGMNPAAGMLGSSHSRGSAALNHRVTRAFAESGVPAASEAALSVITESEVSGGGSFLETSLEDRKSNGGNAVGGTPQRTMQARTPSGVNAGSSVGGGGGGGGGGWSGVSAPLTSSIGASLRDRLNEAAMEARAHAAAVAAAAAVAGLPRSSSGGQGRRRPPPSAASPIPRHRGVMGMGIGVSAVALHVHDIEESAEEGEGACEAAAAAAAVAAAEADGLLRSSPLPHRGVSPCSTGIARPPRASPSPVLRSTPVRPSSAAPGSVGVEDGLGLGGPQHGAASTGRPRSRPASFASVASIASSVGVLREDSLLQMFVGQAAAAFDLHAPPVLPPLGHQSQPLLPPIRSALPVGAMPPVSNPNSNSNSTANAITITSQLNTVNLNLSTGEEPGSHALPPLSLDPAQPCPSTGHSVSLSFGLGQHRAHPPSRLHLTTANNALLVSHEADQIARAEEQAEAEAAVAGLAAGHTGATGATGGATSSVAAPNPGGDPTHASVTPSELLDSRDCPSGPSTVGVERALCSQPPPPHRSNSRGVRSMPRMGAGGCNGWGSVGVGLGSAAHRAVSNGSQQALEHMSSIRSIVLEQGRDGEVDLSHYMRRVSSITKLLHSEGAGRLPEPNGFQWVYGLTGKAGSCMYMAPEVFRMEPYNQECDVFGFAVLMLETLGRELLLLKYFHTREGASLGMKEPLDYARRVSEGFRPARPPRLSERQWGLVCRCWHPDPCERPSMSEVVGELEAMREERIEEDLREQLRARGITLTQGTIPELTPRAPQTPGAAAAAATKLPPPPAPLPPPLALPMAEPEPRCECGCIIS